jgi:putative RNA 2'-phosphotransferase
MITEKENKRISKFLSFVLRHHPELIGIELDGNGWTDVSLLIQKSGKTEPALDFEMLKYIVDTNAKKRFSFNDQLDKIRANQGHSVEVDLGYSPQEPPEVLYHGTGAFF